MPLTIERSSVARKLKAQTHTLHQESEKLLIPKLQQIGSAKDYAAILKTFYGFYHPLEQILPGYITPAHLPDMDGRLKSHLVLKDLTALGREEGQPSGQPIPLCTELPRVASLPEALGCLYVLEGSTLGGRVISKMLLQHKAAGLTQEHLHFFSGYGDETGAKWNAVLHLLEQFPGESSAVIQGANQTFLSFKNWILITLY
jgi:heme oxygenase